MQINIEEVPLGIRRRAAQLLESVRGTEMDPTKGSASLSGEVTAIYRPDIKDVAYYEFAVDLGRSRSAVTFSGGGADDKTLDLPAKEGFIIASAAGHDHPISHWSLNREPPSRQVARAAEENGEKVARVFKMDSLSYVGETSKGALAGQTGQLPLPISGLPEDIEKAKGRITSTMAQPRDKGKDDEATSKEPHEVITKGARVRKVEFAPVKSWKELREGYEKAFGPLLKGLAQNAAPSWEIDALVAELGEGIMTGTSQKVALLEADAAVEVSGDGAKLVKVEVMKINGKGGCIALHVADEQLREEVSFDLHIAYRSGLSEHLRFFAVSPSTPSGRKPDSGMNVFEE